jgi:hypothetical protein
MVKQVNQMASEYRDPDYLKTVAEGVDDFNYDDDLGPETNALALAGRVDDDLLKARLVNGEEEIPPSFKLMSGGDAEELMSTRQQRQVKKHPEYEGGLGNANQQEASGPNLMPYTDRNEAIEELLDRGYEELVDIQYEDNIPRKRAIFARGEDAALAQLQTSETINGEWRTQGSQFYAVVEDVSKADELHHGVRIIDEDEGIIGTSLSDHRIEQLDEVGITPRNEVEVPEILETISKKDQYAGKGLERAARELEG